MEMAQSIHSVDSYNIIDEIDFGETIVFIKFGTDWCLPCKQIEQILVDIENSITYTIDVENDDFEEFLSKNRIYNIPTTIIKYKKNKSQFVGLRTAEDINSMIHNLKTLYPSN